jgi:hypothetical protein
MTPNTMKKPKTHDNRLMYHAGPVKGGEGEGETMQVKEGAHDSLVPKCEYSKSMK